MKLFETPGEQAKFVGAGYAHLCSLLGMYLNFDMVMYHAHLDSLLVMVCTSALA